MDNNDNQVVIPTGSEGDNPQGTLPNDNQPGGNTPNDGQPVALTPEQITALQTENGRLKGQTSALTKKLTTLMRGNSNQPFNNQPNGGEGGDEDTRVFEAAFELSEAKLRNELETKIFPLYDGSDPTYANEAQLPAQELARIRQNPWAFASRPSLLHALKTGDLQPAMLDIEEAISARVEEAGNNNDKPKGVVKTVNPNPVAPAAPANQPQGRDLWSMPMEQLETLNASAVQELTGR
jgi:hypothetical protein